jgi:hypothetical protein
LRLKKMPQTPNKNNTREHVKKLVQFTKLSFFGWIT